MKGDDGMLDFNVLNAGYESVLAGGMAGTTGCTCDCLSECHASCDCDFDCPCTTCEAKGVTDDEATRYVAVNNYLFAYRVSRDGAFMLLGQTVMGGTLSV
jgi:hypothetical protein